MQLGAGFAGYVILGLVIGLAYEKVSKIIPLFTVLYGIYLSVGGRLARASVVLCSYLSLRTWQSERSAGL